MSQPLSVEQAEEQLCALIDERFSPDRESPEGMREDWSLVNKAIDAMILAVRAEQQETVDTLKSEQSESDEVMFKALARAGEAEQQLASARKELEDERTFRCEHEAATAARAQVLAQVKALIVNAAHRNVWCDTPHNIRARLDALQPDPDLAVLSTSEREQALEKACYASSAATIGRTEEGSRFMAEARRLLKLPTEPQP